MAKQRLPGRLVYIYIYIYDFYCEYTVFLNPETHFFPPKLFERIKIYSLFENHSATNVQFLLQRNMAARYLFSRISLTPVRLALKWK
jgi:hypothetical protein